jgi:8-oxo-dGTP diphosphatase
MAVKRFPCGSYGKAKLTFHAAPLKSPIRAFAALVVPIRGEEVLLANIGDRGWCIPSGRVEPFEESLETARRECIEEAGAHLRCLQYMGHYRIQEKEEVRYADLFVAKVEGLCEISMPQESLGRRFVHRSSLEAVYYNWDDLIASVFDYAFEIIGREPV